MFPLFAIPLVYNYVFLVGLMNYIFGIGVALWALAGWVALRERAWPARFALSTACVPALFFCHLSALGIYGVGVLAFEISRLWERRIGTLAWPHRRFCRQWFAVLAAAPLLIASPTMDLVGLTYWDQRGKMDGLMYVVSDYSDIAAFAFIAVMVASIVWAVRHHVLRFHPPVFALIVVGAAVYFPLPRIMFDTYMTDQRVPIGVAFMLFACGDLELRRRLVRQAFMVVLIVIVTARLIEIDYNWSQLSDSTSEFRSSVRRIALGSKVFDRLCRSRARRGRARPWSRACRMYRHHRALRAGHHGVHRGRQAADGCASRISRLCRSAGRHAAGGGAAHPGG